MQQMQSNSGNPTFEERKVCILGGGGVDWTGAHGTQVASFAFQKSFLSNACAVTIPAVFKPSKRCGFFPPETTGFMGFTQVTLETTLENDQAFGYWT